MTQSSSLSARFLNGLTEDPDIPLLLVSTCKGWMRRPVMACVRDPFTGRIARAAGLDFAGNRS